MGPMGSPWGPTFLTFEKTPMGPAPRSAYNLTCFPCRMASDRLFAPSFARQPAYEDYGNGLPQELLCQLRRGMVWIKWALLRYTTKELLVNFRVCAVGGEIKKLGAPWAHMGPMRFQIWNVPPCAR